MSRRVRRIPDSERWKWRRAMIAPAPAPTHIVEEALTPTERARVARWVSAQIVSYPSDRCLCCRRPIVYGANWIELVNDNARTRFHFDCAPVWRAQQEAGARRAMGMKETSKC